MNTSDKVHPTTKKPPTIPTTKTATATAAATTTTTAATATPPLKPPPYKNQQFAPAPRYRPRPPPTHRDDLDRDPRRHRQCCTCKCFLLTIFWAILITIAILILAAVAAVVLYAVYDPKLPSFTLQSVKIAEFNLSSPTQFNAHTKLFNLSLSTTNPNHKIKFYYNNPIKLTLSTHQNIQIGHGNFPSFTHDVNNDTMLFTTITNKENNIDDVSFGNLQNDMKQKNGRVMKLLVKIDTKLMVKTGDKVNVNNVGLRVTCGEIKIHGSKNNGKFSVEIVHAHCNVHLFIVFYAWEIPI